MVSHVHGSSLSILSCLPGAQEDAGPEAEPGLEPVYSDMELRHLK